MITRRSTLVAIVVLALLSAACSNETNEADEQHGASGGVATTDTGASTFERVEPPAASTQGAESSTTTAATSTIEWSNCGQLECGEVVVPLDHLSDDGDTLRIAVARLRAERDRLGVLIVNPGGPGASGIEFLDAFAAGVFPDVLGAFDIVSFDPRGVGGSEPRFACGDDGEHLAITERVDDIVDTPAEVELAEAAVDLCLESMGRAAGLLHTDYVARDMDLVRAALGETQVSYLGFSYGSVIGTWYASLYPDRVRAMVLDGASDPIDPSSTSAERVANDLIETETFGLLLERAVAACDDESCPMFNNGDPEALYYEATRRFDLVNDEVGGNPLAGALGLITTLYTEDTWNLLHRGVADLVLDDDPSVFAALARFQLTDARQPSFVGHVNCLDDWVVEPDVDRSMRRADDLALDELISDQLPLLAALEVDTFSTCPFFDRLNPLPLSVDLDGGDVPILVIGNPNDPATPFAESRDLALETLSNGWLIEVEHASHTVYPDNSCVVDAVHDLLIDLELPNQQRVICGRED